MNMLRFAVMMATVARVNVASVLSSTDLEDFMERREEEEIGLPVVIYPPDPESKAYQEQSKIDEFHGRRDMEVQAEAYEQQGR